MRIECTECSYDYLLAILSHFLCRRNFDFSKSFWQAATFFRRRSWCFMPSSSFNVKIRKWLAFFHCEINHLFNQTTCYSTLWLPTCYRPPNFDGIRNSPYCIPRCAFKHHWYAYDPINHKPFVHSASRVRGLQSSRTWTSSNNPYLRSFSRRPAAHPHATSSVDLRHHIALISCVLSDNWNKSNTCPQDVIRPKMHLQRVVSEAGYLRDRERRSGHLVNSNCRSSHIFSSAYTTCSSFYHSSSIISGKGFVSYYALSSIRWTQPYSSPSYTYTIPTSEKWTEDHASRFWFQFYGGWNRDFGSNCRLQLCSWQAYTDDVGIIHFQITPLRPNHLQKGLDRQREEMI